MADTTVTRRATLASLLTGAATVGVAAATPARAWAAARPIASASDGVLTIEFDSALHSRLSRAGQVLTALEPGEGVRLADGTAVDRFLMLDSKKAAVTGGQRHSLRGVAREQIEKQVDLTFREDQPGAALMVVRYRNLGKQPVTIAGWWSASHTLLAHPKGAWTFSGSSHPDRRDWVQPVRPDFQQRNYMGMNGSDYGGGTPVAVVWRPDVGLAVGHVETAPKLIALPVASQPGGTRIGLEGDQPIVLQPGETVTLPETFIMVHSGDHFAALDTYRRIMAERGLAAPPIPASSYEPIWCAWGYERNVTPDQVYGTLDKAKSVGCSWAVLDDGWQKSVGDWVADTHRFPGGNADVKAMADRIKTYGMRPKLWISPLSAAPSSDLMRDHPDMLLLDANGSAQNVSWWNSYTLCPAYQPTVDYFKAVTQRIIGEWGYEGLKIDGQDLNGVAPCYNPAHNHARPEESVEKLQDFWKAIYDTAIAINPDTNVEICPCGDSFAFFNVPAINNTPASDPGIIVAGSPEGQDVQGDDGTLGAVFRRPCGIERRRRRFRLDLWHRRHPLDQVHLAQGQRSQPTDPLPPGGFVLTPEKEKLWRHWIALYRQNMLSRGQYRGELYDIGFDKPEGHVVAADGKLHYAFYAKTWSGPIDLRGLGKGRYHLTNSFTGASLGTASATDNRIQASFDRFLVIEATPAGDRRMTATTARAGRLWLINALITVVAVGHLGRVFRSVVKARISRHAGLLHLGPDHDPAGLHRTAHGGRHARTIATCHRLRHGGRLARCGRSDGVVLRDHARPRLSDLPDHLAVAAGDDRHVVRAAGRTDRQARHPRHRAGADRAADLQLCARRWGGDQRVDVVRARADRHAVLGRAGLFHEIGQQLHVG